MNRIPVSNGLVFVLMLGLGLQARAGDPAVEELRTATIETLQAMKATYASQYAPKVWKKKYAGWDIDTAYKKAESAAESAETLQQARGAIVQFVSSMKDYHVSVGFFSTEKASLPFTVKTVGGRTFFADIDREKMPESAFPFMPGDELITFNGKPIAEEIGALVQLSSANVPATDVAWADLMLTRRRASRGFPVPSGSALIGGKKRGEEKVRQYQLVWDYAPDEIGVPFSVPKSDETALTRMKSRKMVAGMKMASGENLNLFGLGARESYIPELGKKIWENAKEMEGKVSFGFFSMPMKRATTFDAYIYKNAQGRKIGVIRIPSYSPQDESGAVKEFADLLNRFESETDGLVIDQINNPGGSVFYLYALASMLSDQPLMAPKHRMSVTPSDIVDALPGIEALKQIKTDEDARNALGPDWSGYPVTLSFANALRDNLSFMVSEWRQAKRITDPFYVGGVDMINPSFEANYSKPVMVVVNELCFSGGDFFPAILQDNKRAKIFGHRTAGAGGYVNEGQIASLIGVEYFTITGSIAERVDGNPIENLGVTPDIAYELTPADMQQGFSGYKVAIQKGIDSLLPKK
jgi:hypothetical protein